MRSLRCREIKRCFVREKCRIGGGGEEEQDVGRSRSHGGLQDLVVEVQHTSPELHLPFSCSEAAAEWTEAGGGGGGSMKHGGNDRKSETSELEREMLH